MARNDDVAAWTGRRVVSADGEEVGRLVDVFVDDQTDEPEWLAVDIGDKGGLAYVPVDGAEASEEDVVVGFSAEAITQAPSTPDDGVLTREEEASLYRHYGLDDAAVDARDTGEVMTRSEEELRVATRPAERERVRLRKWVETEHVSVAVAVQREEIRVEREPITAENMESAMRDAELGEAEVEVVLREDEIVTTKVTVPKERIRLEKDVVTEEREVSADLRKERVEVERPGGS